jgi:magnesium-transporting ATPase (P-type)
MSLEDLMKGFHTDLNVSDVTASAGLSSTQTHILLTTYGLNVLSPPAKIPLWLLFLVQFTNLFMILLMVAGNLT